MKRVLGLMNKQVHLDTSEWKCETQRQKESFKDAKEKRNYP